MIVHGLFGPSLAPKNLATTLPAEKIANQRDTQQVKGILAGQFLLPGVSIHAGTRPTESRII